MFSSLISSALALVSGVSSKFSTVFATIAVGSTLLAVLFAYLYISKYAEMTAQVELLTAQNVALNASVNSCNLKLSETTEDLNDSREAIKNSMEICADNITELTNLNNDLTEYRSKYLGTSTSTCQSTTITDGDTNETTDVIIIPLSTLDERRRLLSDLGMLQGADDADDNGSEGSTDMGAAP